MKMQKSEMAALFERARAAAMAAGEAAIPRPMIVSEADGLSDRPKPGGYSSQSLDNYVVRKLAAVAGLIKKENA